MWFAAHYSSYASVPWLVHLSVQLLRREDQIARLLDKTRNDEIERKLERKYRERWMSDSTSPPLCDGSASVDSCAAPSDAMVPRNVTHIRAQLYEYQYATNRLAGKDVPVGEGWEEGAWWRRREVKSFMPPISLSDPSVAQFLEHYGWGSPGR
jgi:hypothetical protein